MKGCGGGLDPPMQEVGCVVMSSTSLCFDQAVLYYWHCLWTSGRLTVVGRNILENGPPWGTGWC